MFLYCHLVGKYGEESKSDGVDDENETKPKKMATTNNRLLGIRSFVRKVLNALQNSCIHFSVLI